jgi:hypothetical protein
VVKSSSTVLATSVFFKKTTQIKQSHNKQKYAQSGHPDFLPPLHQNLFLYKVNEE